MKNSKNIQIIKNIHKVLAQSINHLLVKSKKNKKILIHNNFCTNKTNKQLKENLTNSEFIVNDNNVNQLAKSKTNNYSYSYFLINNKNLKRNSHYLKKQNNSNDINRRDSNIKYLFENYPLSDSIESSKNNNSFLKIKVPQNKRKRKLYKNKGTNSEVAIKIQNNKNIKIKHFYNDNKFKNNENKYKSNINIKEFEDRKVQKNYNFKKNENINSKLSTSFSSINIKKIENNDNNNKKFKNKNYKQKINNKNIKKSLNTNKNIDKKTINVKKAPVLNNSPLELEMHENNNNEKNKNNNINDNNNKNNINENNNINDNNNNNNINDRNDIINDRNDIINDVLNGNSHINDKNDIKREDFEKKEAKIDKEEKYEQINFLTEIKLESIFGLGDYEIKNDNQDSLFIMTNNPSIRIFQNNINNYNYFFEENIRRKNNINNNNIIIQDKIFTILGICDGHGDQGRTISNYISTIVPTKIKNYLYSISNKNTEISKDNLENELKINIKKIFSSINTKLNSMQIIDTSYSGSCFCSLFITKSSIISLNLGNSKAVVGCIKEDENSKKIHFYPYNLTYEHTPYIEKEKERIIENGGEILYEKDEYNREFGPLKIWKKNHLVPGLLITRSFGDKEASLIGVISEPDIKYYEMKKEYKFIVVGSFGLWNFIESEECVKIIGKFYMENNIDGAVNEIIKIVKSRWIEEKEDIIEDISIIVGFLKEEK